MPNTLQTLDWFAKESLRLLWVNCVMGQLVHRGYDSEFRGKKGDTARILRPVNFVAKDFDEATGVEVQDIKESYVPLTVDTHLDVTFEYGSAEKALKMPDFRDRYIEPAMKAIAEEIDKRTIAAAYKGFYSYAGTPGTTPRDKASILAARKNLQDQLVPLEDRKFVMDPAAEAQYLELFSDADKDGSTAALREASLGRRFGLDTYVDQHIGLPGGGLHTAGNLSGATVSGAVAAGATSLTITGTGGQTIKAGDIFTIGSLSGTFVCTQDATVSGTTTATATINFFPELPSALAGGEAITLVGGGSTYVNNLMFTRGAIALAFAKLEQPEGAAFSKVYNYKGFALRMVLSYNATYKKEMLSIDVLFGAKCIDPRLGTRLLG